MFLLLKWIHLLSIATWLGTIVFFSFFAAPTVFKTLGEETGGKVISALFNHYYLVNSLAGVAAVLSAIVLGFRAEGRSFPDILRTVILMVMLTATLYAGTFLRGKVVEVKAKIRENPPQETLVRLRGEFDRLHRKSVLINLSVLAGGVLTLLLISARARL